ncbi:MAG: hypothetical protein WA985_00275 [Erythrobacter sp.]
MFFVKALGGCLAVVFAGFYAFGFFDDGHDEQVRALNIVKQAEIADNNRADSGWGPECDELRDELFGFSGDGPLAAQIADRSAEAEPRTDKQKFLAEAGSGISAIAKVASADRKLRAAGCDVDKAPGAFSPFEPDKGNFKTVTSELSDGTPRGAGGWSDSDSVNSDGNWGGDSNAFNEGGSDDWGRGQ